MLAIRKANAKHRYHKIKIVSRRAVRVAHQNRKNAQAYLKIVRRKAIHILHSANRKAILAKRRATLTYRHLKSYQKVKLSATGDKSNRLFQRLELLWQRRLPKQLRKRKQPLSK